MTPELYYCCENKTCVKKVGDGEINWEKSSKGHWNEKEDNIVAIDVMRVSSAICPQDYVITVTM